MATGRLFNEPLPEGFLHRPDFITAAQERDLLARIADVEFHDMKMRGVVARRRVIHYGVQYSFETFRATPGPPIPAFLMPLRGDAARFAGVAAEALQEALITEYPPGATIGWHRDAAPFGVVIGVSLLSACRFRFRRGRVRAWETAEVVLERRSAYVLTGAARHEWEHSIPAVRQARYSITFRTLKRR